jgi:uncharacterized protein YebE (UPF0316 family)
MYTDLIQHKVHKVVIGLEGRIDWDIMVAHRIGQILHDLIEHVDAIAYDLCLTGCRVHGGDVHKGIRSREISDSDVQKPTVLLCR